MFKFHISCMANELVVDCKDNHGISRNSRRAFMLASCNQTLRIEISWGAVFYTV